VSELEDDLRATTEDIAADAAELQAIEEEKGRLDPQDPRMAELSEDGERVARGIVPKTVVQRGLVDELRDPDESSDDRHSAEG